MQLRKKMNWLFGSEGSGTLVLIHTIERLQFSVCLP